jgi:hypothetical protein
LHKYAYVLNNPVNLVDPSGLIPQRPRSEADRARKAVKELSRYSVIIHEDFGWKNGAGGSCDEWIEGNWRSAWELEQILTGVAKMANAMGGKQKFARNMGRTIVNRSPADWQPFVNARTVFVFDIRFYDLTFYEGSSLERNSEDEVRNTIVHEFAHLWDNRHLFTYSSLMKKVTESTRRNGKYVPGGDAAMKDAISPANSWEDWADAVGHFLFPLPGYQQIGPIRETFVEEALKAQNPTQFDRTIRRLFYR